MERKKSSKSIIFIIVLLLVIQNALSISRCNWSSPNVNFDFKPYNCHLYGAAYNYNGHIIQPNGGSGVGTLIYHNKINFATNWHIFYKHSLLGRNWAIWNHYEGFATVFSSHSNVRNSYSLGVDYLSPSAFIILFDFDLHYKNTISFHECYSQGCRLNYRNGYANFPEDYKDNNKRRDVYYYYHIIYTLRTNSIAVYLGYSGHWDLTSFKSDIAGNIGEGYLSIGAKIQGIARYIDMDGSSFCSQMNRPILEIPSEIVVFSTVDVKVYYNHRVEASQYRIASNLNSVYISSSWSSLYHDGDYYYKTCRLSGFNTRGSFKVYLKNNSFEVQRYVTIISPKIHSMVFYKTKPNQKLFPKNGLSFYEWGSAGQKGFDMGEKENGYIYADYQLLDVTRTPIETVETTIKKLGMQINFRFGSIKQSLSVVDKNKAIVRFGVFAERAGQYEICSQYLKPSHGFDISFNSPSVSRSYCAITNYPNMPIKGGVSYDYSCNLIDDAGDTINPKNLNQIFSITYEGKIYRNDKEHQTVTVLVTESNIKISFLPFLNGQYRYEISWAKKDMNKSININSNQNKITVIPVPPILHTAHIFNYYKQNWKFPASSLKELIFDYPKTDYIIAIDFADIDSDQTLFSKISYSNLVLGAGTELSGTLSNPHGTLEHNIQLAFKLLQVKDRNAIVAFPADGQSLSIFYRRSSFPYELTLKYKAETITIKFPSLLGNYNNLMACPHSINNSYALFTPRLSTEKFRVGSIIAIGTLTLKTIDNYFYNYFIEDSLLKVEGISEYYFVKNELIAGLYDVKIRTSIANTHQLAIKVGNQAIVQGTHKITVLAIEAIDSIIDSGSNGGVKEGNLNEYTISKIYTADLPVDLTFIGKDEYSNILKYEPSESNSNLGVSITVTVNDILYPISNFQFVYRNNFYHIIDKDNKITGIFKIVIKSKSNKILTFIYTKTPGALSLNNSIVKIINAPKIAEGKDAFVVVEMRDKNNLNLGLSTISYELGISKIKVQMKNTVNKVYDLSSDSKDGINPKFKYSQPSADKYYAFGLYDGKEITQCVACFFEVFNDNFSFDYSQMKAILTTEILMTEKSPLLLNNKKYRPLFNFLFFKTSGERVTNVKKDIIIQALFNCDKGLNEAILELTWGPFDSIIWQFPPSLDITSLGRTKCKLTVKENDKEKIYPIALLAGDFDFDDNNLSPDKSSVSVNTIETTVGKYESFKIEFRSTEGYIYSKSIDKSKLIMNLNPAEDALTYNIDNQIRNGVFIVTIMLTKSIPRKTNSELQITYNSMPLPSVKVIVHSGELESFVIDNASLKTNEGKDIKDGNALEITTIKIRPYDKYGNICTQFFDDQLYSNEQIVNLFKITHSTNDIVKVSVASYPIDNWFLLHLKVEKKGTIKLNSWFFNKNADTYSLIILNGKSSELSEGKIMSTSKIIAGDSITFTITCRDINGNIVVPITEDDNIFTVKIINTSTDSSPEITKGKINAASGTITYELKLTEIGETIIKAYYMNDEIKLSNNVAFVSNSNIDYDRTKVIYNDVQYINKNPIGFSISAYPFFSLDIYDKNSNSITNLPLGTILKAQIGNIQLCLLELNIGKPLFYVCENSKEEYSQLSTSANHDLVFTIGTNKLELTASFTGNLDNDTSSKPIVPTKTLVSHSVIQTIAGVAGIIKIELMTEDGKRPNAFLTNINDSIKLLFSKNEAGVITSKIIQGEKVGEYIIIIISKKTYLPNDNSTMTIKINNINLNPIQLIVKPNIATHGYFVDSLGKKLTVLPNATTDSLYNLRAMVFDEFNNIASISGNKFSYLIKPPNEKADSLVESTKKVIVDQSIAVSITTKYIGTYKIFSPYFDQEYDFVCNPGAPHYSNSIIDVPIKTIAGETIKIYVTPYDQYNNLIDPSTLTNNPFTINYRVKITDNTFGDYITLPTTTLIEVNNNKKSYVYSPTLTIKGNYLFQGSLSSDNDINCLNCVLNVESTNIVSILHSLILSFNNDKGKYEEIIDHNYENNAVNNLHIRLYPKDQYGNTIEKIDNINSYGAKIRTEETECSFTTTAPNKQYIQFIATDNTNYTSLQGGPAKLVITQSGKSVIKEITLIGNGKFDEIQVIDLSKTTNVYHNLMMIAGETGFMQLELRTTNNLKYMNKNDINVIIEKCNVMDETFVATKIHNKPSGLLYYTITSNKANTFPKNIKCELKVTANNVVLEKVKPTMEVYHDRLISAKVHESNLQIEEPTKLHDTPGDKLVQFKVLGYDKYNNLARISSSSVKVKIRNQDKVSFDYNSNTEIQTGYQNYIVSLTKIGKYDIHAELNYDETNLFPANSYTITITYGSLSIAHTLFEIENKIIVAGDKSLMRITPKDKYDNDIPTSFVRNNLKITTKTPSGIETVLTDPVNVGASITYTATLVEKGENDWIVTKESERLDCYGCVTIVNPNICVMENTSFHFKTKEGVYTRLQKETDPVYTHQTNTILNFYLIFEDKYNNAINTIPENVKVIGLTMSGHSMTKIVFSSSISSDKTRYDILLPSDTSTQYIYNHLVERQGYDFQFTVQEGSFSKIYNLKIDHYTTKDDSRHGNGIYDIAMTTKSDKVTVTSAEKYLYLFSLKTKDNLIYNDDINFTDKKEIDCISRTLDVSFACAIIKAGSDYGEYYAEMIMNVVTYDEPNTVIIQVKEPNQSLTNTITLTVTVSIAIPDPEKTIITFDCPPQIPAGTNLEFQFTMTDSQNNLYRNNIEVKKYLKVYNKEIEVPNYSIELVGDKNYKVSFVPSYPPRDIKANIYYINGIHSYNIFKNPPSTFIISTIDWSKTDVFGKNIDVLIAGEEIDLNVILKDSTNYCIESEDVIPVLKATIKGDGDGDSSLIKYDFERIPDEKSECKLTYRVISKGKVLTISGFYYILISTENGTEVAKKFHQVIAGKIDKNKFEIKREINCKENYNAIPAGHIFSFEAYSYDKFENRVLNQELKDNLEVSFSKNGDTTGVKILTNEENSGILTFTVSITKAGEHSIKYTYIDEDRKRSEIKVNNISGPTNVNIIPGDCNVNKIKGNDEEIKINNEYKGIIGKYTKISFSCSDEYDNQILIGGALFGGDIIFTTGKEEQSGSTLKAETIDHNNGTYDIQFLPLLSGQYDINVSFNNFFFKSYSVLFSNSACDKNAPIECPDGSCVVNNKYECLSNGCEQNKPFKCSPGDTECVFSKNKCNSPDPNFAFKCSYMEYFVREEYECSFHMQINCFNQVLCPDGICRKSLDYTPSKRVCPIDSYLCPDFSCRKHLSECHKYPDCKDNEIRCPGQSCVLDQKLCPTTITCRNKDHVVCPDGLCVKNEVECTNLTKCIEPNLFLCSNNSCVKDAESCPRSIACGHGKFLDEDNSCKTER